MPSWSGSAAQIQYDKLTHINYAFIVPYSDGSFSGVDSSSKLNAIVTAAHSRGIKVLISVGGWNDGDDSAFHVVAANQRLINAFVQNLLNVVGTYDLDGVDIDWEFPDPGNSEGAYASLMASLSSVLHARGKLLTAAVTSGRSRFLQTTRAGRPSIRRTTAQAA